MNFVMSLSSSLGHQCFLTVKFPCWLCLFSHLAFQWDIILLVVIVSCKLSNVQRGGNAFLFFLAQESFSHQPAAWHEPVLKNIVLLVFLLDTLLHRRGFQHRQWNMISCLCLFAGRATLAGLTEIHFLSRRKLSPIPLLHQLSLPAQRLHLVSPHQKIAFSLSLFLFFQFGLPARELPLVFKTLFFEPKMFVWIRSVSNPMFLTEWELLEQDQWHCKHIPFGATFPILQQDSLICDKTANHINVICCTQHPMSHHLPALEDSHLPSSFAMMLWWSCNLVSVQQPSWKHNWNVRCFFSLKKRNCACLFISQSWKIMFDKQQGHLSFFLVFDNSYQKKSKHFESNMKHSQIADIVWPITQTDQPLLLFCLFCAALRPLQSFLSKIWLFGTIRSMRSNQTSLFSFCGTSSEQPTATSSWNWVLLILMQCEFLSCSVGIIALLFFFCIPLFAKHSLPSPLLLPFCFVQRQWPDLLCFRASLSSSLLLVNCFWLLTTSEFLFVVVSNRTCSSKAFPCSILFFLLVEQSTDLGGWSNCSWGSNSKDVVQPVVLMLAVFSLFKWLSNKFLTSILLTKVCNPPSVTSLRLHCFFWGIVIRQPENPGDCGCRKMRMLKQCHGIDSKHTCCNGARNLTKTLTESMQSRSLWLQKEIANWLELNITEWRQQCWPNSWMKMHLRHVAHCSDAPWRSAASVAPFQLWVIQLMACALSGSD